MKPVTGTLRLILALVMFVLCNGCALSPEKVCQKLGSLTGGAVGEDEIAECVDGMVELKDEVDGPTWKRLGKCINAASNEEQAVSCMLAAALSSETEE